MVAKLSNRVSYFFVTLGILILVAIGINALTPGVVPNPGHDIQTVSPPNPCTAGYFLQFNGNTWQCASVSGATSLWTESGGDIYRSSGNVVVGNEGDLPYGVLGKLHVDGSIYAFKDGANPAVMVGDGLPSPYPFGGMAWYSSTDVMRIGLLTRQNTINFNMTNEGIGINTTNPDSKLQVKGTVHATSLIADNLVEGTTGVFHEIETNILSTDSLAFSDLLINGSQFSMKANNSDNCVVRLLSYRSVGSTTGVGAFNITCYAPSGVCGNTLLETGIGEQCDPPGSYYWTSIISGTGWNCQTGNPYSSYFFRARVTCGPTCQYSPSLQYCDCKTSCIDPVTKDRYYGYFDCYNSNPTEACNNYLP